MKNILLTDLYKQEALHTQGHMDKHQGESGDRGRRQRDARMQARPSIVVPTERNPGGRVSRFRIG